MAHTPDHDCYDNAVEVDCPNELCDNGLVVVASIGDIIHEEECEECDGFGIVWECSVCGSPLF